MRNADCRMRSEFKAEGSKKDKSLGHWVIELLREKKIKAERSKLKAPAYAEAPAGRQSSNKDGNA